MSFIHWYLAVLSNWQKYLARFLQIIQLSESDTIGQLKSIKTFFRLRVKKGVSSDERIRFRFLNTNIILQKWSFLLEMSFSQTFSCFEFCFNSVYFIIHET